MIWGAPAWSPVSPQLTHGFPRRLVDAKHGGFVPGNITVSSRASNLALRRVAVCDVASLVSKRWLDSVGLSFSRLLNLRHAAIRYTRGSYLPHYLTRGMLETGVSFATFEPLNAETLQGLSEALPTPWRQDEGGQEEEDSDQEPQHAVETRLMLSIGQQASGDFDPERERASLDRLLFSDPSEESSGAEDQEGGPRPAPQQPARDSSQTASTSAQQATKKRKRRTGSSSASSSTRSKDTGPPSTGTAVDQGPARQETTTESDPFSLATLPLSDFKRDVFPSGQSRKALFEYLAKHQPLKRTVGNLQLILAHTNWCTLVGHGIRTMPLKE